MKLLKNYTFTTLKDKSRSTIYENYGLDVVQKTVGVAISDPFGLHCSGTEIIQINEGSGWSTVSRRNWLTAIRWNADSRSARNMN